MICLLHGLIFLMGCLQLSSSGLAIPKRDLNAAWQDIAPDMSNKIYLIFSSKMLKGSFKEKQQRNVFCCPVSLANGPPKKVLSIMKKGPFVPQFHETAQVEHNRGV